MKARGLPRLEVLALVGLLSLLVLPVGPAGAGEASRLPPWRPLHLEDASGRVVGRVIDAAIDEVSVLVRAGGRDLFLTASPDRLALPAVGAAVFESADCSPPAWVFFVPIAVSDLLMFAPAVPAPGGEVLVPDGPTVMKVIVAHYDPSADPPCVAIPAAMTSVQAGLKVLDLDDFPPPFTLH